MNIFRNVRFRHIHAKCFSMEAANRFTLEYLKNRSIIKLQGEFVTEFLQSLITNDINHLSSQPAIFTMFLNKAGRVLYDAIVYKSEDKQRLFVECDAQADVELVKHLKMFRVRKKIDIDVASDLGVYVAFKSNGYQLSDFNNDKPIDVKNSFKTTDLIICNDPRLHQLGLRIIAPHGKDVLPNLSNLNISLGEPNEYQIHRFKLGVGEGVDELPQSKCFPLESNCDYLHGVSFHKGCYLGQEFTARTHHTGVIRKRLMPLALDGTLTNTCTKYIETTHGVVAGKLRGFQGEWGLGLLKVDVALQETSPLIFGGDEVYVKGKTHRPFWWPAEAPKLNVLKNKDVKME